MASELLVLLFLILLNGFFSLSEMALVSSRKARLKAEADKGKRAYRMAFLASESPGRYLSTIQVSITLIGILTGAVSGATVSQRLSAWLSSVPVLAPHAESIAVALVVILVTLISVVLGELVPKSIALRSPESIAAFSIMPMHVLSLVFAPLVRALSAMTEGIVHLLGLSRKSGPSVTAEEVKILVEQGEESGVFESAEREMVEGVLNLDDRRVTLFMTPRTEVVVLDLDDASARHRRLIIEHSEFAYLPVVQGDLDHPRGMLPIKRALTMMAEGRFSAITDCMEPPVMIPEHFSGLQALGILKDAKKTAGLIVDEYGGVSGLVTVGDLLEVIASVPQPERAEEPEIFQRSDGSWLVDGSMPIDEFARHIGCSPEEISGEDYETVAGWILHLMGTIPKAGDVIDHPPLSIEVMDMDGKRIDKVLVRKRE